MGLFDFLTIPVQQIQTTTYPGWGAGLGYPGIPAVPPGLNASIIGNSVQVSPGGGYVSQDWLRLGPPSPSSPPATPGAGVALAVVAAAVALGGKR